MAIDRFMIAPLQNGLQTDLRPWLIPDDAFEQLNNAYVFRGRVRKRFGITLMNQSVDPSLQQLYSRLRINLGNADGAGNFNNGALPVPGNTWAIGQIFSVTDSSGNIQILTVYQAFGVMLTTGGTAIGAFDTATGLVVINGLQVGSAVYFYPATPVMGIAQYETASINDENTFAFDTQFAYQFSGGGWERLAGAATAGASTWTGSDSQFFWTTNYRGTTDNVIHMYVTNFNPPDFLRYWNNTTAQWNFLKPAYDSGNPAFIIVTARVIVPFHNRLILLNTVEVTGAGNTTFLNRARWSQLGSPVEVDSFYDDVPGKGSYLDAPIQEQIITAEFLKDRLIVFFERSTWEFVYTGNDIAPFRWQQINTELGAESTFSIVPFDKVCLGIGNVGIHACNGANVERIDNKIPDLVFQFHNGNSGPQRIQGIRDYKVEMVYWSFPDETPDPTYPTRVLVYNYKTGSWAINNDSITALGYFQNVSDETWQTTTITWEEDDATWQDGVLQSEFRQVLGGNQEGFMFLVDPDNNRNMATLQITDVTPDTYTTTLTIINHNLAENDFIYIENMTGITSLNNTIFQIALDAIDPTNKIVISVGSSGTYTGGGTVAHVSVIDIFTKQYNFYVDKGRNVYVSKVDFLVDKTTDGQVTVDYFVSSSGLSLVQDGISTNTIMGNATLETSPYTLEPYFSLERTQDRIWHPVYPQADGECVQLRIYLNDTQMLNPDIAFSGFELHAMTFYCTPTASRLQ